MTKIKANPELEKSWLNELKNEFEKPYMENLKAFLLEDKKLHQIFPPSQDIFNAFNRTPFDRVRVVILGQDPYHGKGQAHGLSFSVPKGVKPPPSLVNIFKEIHADLGIEPSKNGDLSKWAEQGVFLLNATLSVRENQAGSHQNKGWEIFTDEVIKTLSSKKTKLVFLLWGKYAQAKAELIDDKKHLVLKAPHPSPFSAHTGFLGCKHFSMVNQYLSTNGVTPIDWRIE